MDWATRAQESRAHARRLRERGLYDLAARTERYALRFEMRAAGLEVDENAILIGEHGHLAYNVTASTITVSAACMIRGKSGWMIRTIPNTHEAVQDWLGY